MKLQTELIAAAQAESRRLMIVLHGLGDSSAGYYWLPAALRLPWMNYLLVNAPDQYYGGYSWFDIYGNAEPGVLRSRALLTELFQAQAAAGYPAGQTVLFGFSQGCLMVLETGLRYPERFAGMVGISGFLHDPARLVRELSGAAREQRVLVTHGTEDPLIPREVMEKQIGSLKEAGLPITWRTFPKAHTIDDAEELPLIREFVEGCFETDSAAARRGGAL
jgi:phospholipase/carboxylesterase